MPNRTSPEPTDRRKFLALAGGAALGLGLTGCVARTEAASQPAPTGALPTTAASRRTRLSLAVHTSQLQLAASGLDRRLGFTVAQWPNLSAGPDVIQGFRAHSVDVAANAGIPPIQAAAIGVRARIVAVQERHVPLYRFATAPGSSIRETADFRGRKIAFSQGQAQGVVVLRALREAGITNDDVTLVALPSTQFLTALQSGQVDVAPLNEPVLTKYLDQYAEDGARSVPTDVVDLLTVLWAPVEVLDDPAKLAAVRDFVPLWAQGLVWAWQHTDPWIDTYYVKDQGVTKADGKRIVASLGPPRFPESWDGAITWEQQTADLLADGGFVKKLDATALFDRRFEGLAAQAVPARYREAAS